jgi:spore germination cell wall hydrolase CwlJ-like protein
VIKLLGSRGASAVMGIFMLALGSSEAGAQVSPINYTLKSAVRSLDVDAAAKPLGTVANAASTLLRPAVAATTAVTLGNGTIVQAQPAQSVTVQLGTSVANEAAWLYRAGWPLYALVDRYATNAPLDQESNCLATAVYFEARGESVDGQLAVARVVMNRAASGRYPPSWCATVKQPAQFSFVRHGQFPAVDYASDAWRKAEAVARLAAANAVPSVSTDVLWYHADYVAPSWRRNLVEVQKIGAHIFYRA